MLRRFSNWFELGVSMAVVVFVGMLFLNSPTAPAAAPAEVVAAAGGIDGGEIFGARCAGCHGGDGSGGIGPRLAGKVVARFPDPAAQIAVVSEGRRSMPSFAAKLSADEIAAVVEYTRTVLGG
ncbi:MAG: cytochrome c [Actinobacteria bacterium]|nr:cytochrome c [Actinomycetota bacterium]